MDEIEMHREIRSMNARLILIETETVPVVQRVVKLLDRVSEDDLHEFIEIFKDAAGGLRTIARVASWVKNFTIFGAGTAACLWIYEHMKAIWTAP